MKKRMSKAEKEIRQEIEQEFRKQADRVQIPIMSIPKFYSEAFEGLINGIPVAQSIAASLAKYRVN